jgi:hypothetical protein
MIWSSVLLPDPFTPTTPTVSPAAMCIVKPRSAQNSLCSTGEPGTSISTARWRRFL